MEVRRIIAAERGMQLLPSETKSRTICKSLCRQADDGTLSHDNSLLIARLAIALLNGA